MHIIPLHITILIIPLHRASPFSPTTFIRSTRNRPRKSGSASVSLLVSLSSAAVSKDSSSRTYGSQAVFSCFDSPDYSSTSVQTTTLEKVHNQPTQQEDSNDESNIDFFLVNNLVDVSERVLFHKISAHSTFAYHIDKPFSFLERISKDCHKTIVHSKLERIILPPMV